MIHLLLLISIGMLAAGCDSRKPAQGAPSGEATPPASRVPATPLPPAPKTVLSWHYLGAEAIAADTNGAKLKTVLAAPASKALMDQALASLSKYPERAVIEGTNATNNATSTLLEPLLRDLLVCESYLLSMKASNQTDVALATRLPDERVQNWQTNLTQAATAMGGVATAWKTGNLEGIELQLSQPPALVRMARAGEWFLAGFGRGPLHSLTQVVGSMEKTGRPGASDSNVWLEVEADLAAWDCALVKAASTNLPKLRFALSGRGEKVRTVGQAEFPTPHHLLPEPWNIPTNSIREPLVSFAAFQPAKALLQSRECLKELPAALFPGQLFGWSLADVPYQTYAAFPSPEAGATLAQSLESLSALVASNQSLVFPVNLQFNTNTSELDFIGLPLITPFLRPGTDPETNFLVAGVFPSAKKAKPAPAELFDQVRARTNLLLYAWEITSPRVEAWHNFCMLYSAFTGYDSPNTNAAALRWVLDAGILSSLDNCVTEISVNSPTELEVVRSSAAGFTGLELNLLVRWLENPAFPGYQEPPKAVRRTRPSAIPQAPPAIPQ